MVCGARGIDTKRIEDQCMGHDSGLAAEPHCRRIASSTRGPAAMLLDASAIEKREVMAWMASDATRWISQRGDSHLQLLH